MSYGSTFFGGLEGGASHSTVAIYDAEGKQVALLDGPGTNFWIIGIEEAVTRLGRLIEQARNFAKISPAIKLKCLCLSLSGAEDEKVNEDVRRQMLEMYPALSEEYVICSDTVAPIYTANDIGGAVLIAGTGSNCLLINPDKSVERCGGWGHMLADEGSAYWITHKALKIIFDSEDGIEPPPHQFSTEAVWKAAQKFYKIQTRMDILPHLYSSFSKSEFSKFCKELSDVARTGDPLANWLFEYAGRTLAKYMIAISKKASKSMLHQSGGLLVVCVGSVWLSFDLMRKGIAKQLDEDCTLKELSLLSLTVGASTGAAYMAADYINYPLPRNYSDNYNVFYHYKRN